MITGVLLFMVYVVLFEHFSGYLSYEMKDAFDFLEIQDLIKIRHGNSEFLNILLLDLTITGRKYFEQQELQLQKELEKQRNDIRLRKREQKVRWIQWLIPLLISIAALVNSILARLGS